jgi:hypothetical protein
MEPKEPQLMGNVPANTLRTTSEEKRQIALGTLIGVLTAAVLGLPTLVVSFLAIVGKVDASNGIAIRVLLFAVVANLVLSGSILGLHLRTSRRTTTSLAEELAKIEISLGRTETSLSRLPQLDWCFDAAEHQSTVYSKMAEMARDPRASVFQIVSVWRDPKQGDVRPVPAIKDYYDALEGKIDKGGFTYERLVVMRGPLGHNSNVSLKLHRLMQARKEFRSHCERLLLEPVAPGSRAEIHFFADEGRLLDVAFAFTLDQSRNPLRLVIEIGTTGPATNPGGQRAALGLLSIDNPGLSLIRAFTATLEALRAPDAALVQKVPDDLVLRYLRGDELPVTPGARVG